MQMMIAASAVPGMLPLPPVESVPPSTTAVMMDSVNVDPRLYFAESTFAVSRTPAIAAPMPVRIYVLMITQRLLMPEYSAA